MVVHTVTRVGGADDEPVVLVPAEVRDAVALIGKQAPSETTEGFAKLAHATFNNPVGKEAAGVAGAIQAIVDAMARNSEDAGVLESGCHALRNVVFHCLPNLALVREQGAIPAVVAAMEKHPESEALQAEGCWALLVFCTNEDESVALAKPFAAVVQKAADSFPDNKDIQSRGTFLQALFA